MYIHRRTTMQSFYIQRNFFGMDAMFYHESVNVWSLVILMALETHFCLYRQKSSRIATHHSHKTTLETSLLVGMWMPVKTCIFTLKHFCTPVFPNMLTRRGRFRWRHSRHSTSEEGIVMLLGAARKRKDNFVQNLFRKENANLINFIWNKNCIKTVA